MTSPAAELVRRAQEGDRRAWEELLTGHREDVLKIAFRYLGPSPDLEDVVQDALVHVYRSLHTFKGEARFSTWLYRLVANVVKMHLRAKGARPQLASEQAQQMTRADAQRRPADELTAQRRRAAALYARLDGLSEKKREVLVLHDFEGRPPAEIAELVGAPVMTVRTRLFYARRELYAAMSEDPELEELVAELDGLRATAGRGGE